VTENGVTDIIARYGPVAIHDARKVGEVAPLMSFPLALSYDSKESREIASVPMPYCLLPDLVEHLVYLLRNWRRRLEDTFFFYEQVNQYDPEDQPIVRESREKEYRRLVASCEDLEIAIRGVGQAYPGLGDALAMKSPSKRPQFPIPPTWEIIRREINARASREVDHKELTSIPPVRLHDICTIGSQVAQLGQFRLHAVTFHPDSPFLNPAPYYAIILEQQGESLEVGLIGMIESDEQGIWQRLHLCERTLYHALEMGKWLQARLRKSLSLENLALMRELTREAGAKMEGIPEQLDKVWDEIEQQRKQGPTAQDLQRQRIESEVLQAWEQRYHAIYAAFMALTPPT
jgi:hypothetical protein